MGRIAEALRKAHEEREEKLRLGLGLRIRDQESGIKGQVEETLHPIPSPQSPIRNPLLPAGPMPSWEVHPTVVTLSDRNSSITEQYRAVRTWLLRQSRTGKHHCIAITSSVPREGKTVTVANLAAVMAEVRHLNVLAVDTDFRQGSLSTLFKLPNSPGLADVLGGRATIDEAITNTPLGNLSVLPAGTCQDLNPAELINSTAAARVFEEIRDSYHFILVDTSPVQWLSDVGVIGALCTGIIMVVRMNKTSADVVRQSVQWLQSNNLEVIGCIAAACGGEAAYSGYREPNKDE